MTEKEIVLVNINDHQDIYGKKIKTLTHNTICITLKLLAQEVNMTTVRLPDDMEAKLAILAEKKHKSKSDLIKEALDYLFYKEGAEKDSYEIGEVYFGKYGSGAGDLSITYKQRIKGKINDKIHPY